MEQTGTLYVAILSIVASTYAGLNQLCELIDYWKNYTSVADCVIYDYYGCWCGPGGSGEAVDETDSCCQKHDFCYDNIISKKRESPYFAQYKYLNGRCYDLPNMMAYDICKCDQTFATCLSKSKYNWKFWGERFWPGICDDNRKKLDDFHLKTL